MNHIFEWLYCSEEVDPHGNGNSNCCDHFDKVNKLFSAWHRLYMVSFERGLQAAGLDPSLGLPYWDWTDGRDSQSLELPRLASEENWINGPIKRRGMLTSRYYLYWTMDIVQSCKYFFQGEISTLVKLINNLKTKLSWHIVRIHMKSSRTKSEVHTLVSTILFVRVRCQTLVSYRNVIQF